MSEQLSPTRHVASSLGVVLSQAPGRDPSTVLDGACVADELGYRELWIGEMAMFDSFVLAAAAATATSRIELTVGPLAVNVRTPVGIAMGVGSVQSLGKRRVNVALGTSSDTVVCGWHGRSRAGSTTCLGETADVLRGLLAGEKTEYRGSRVSTSGFRLLVPSPQSSITVAAFGRKAIDVAAAFADRMVLNLVTPAGVGRLRSQLESAASAVGRPAPRLAAWIPAAVDPSAASLAQMRRSKVGYLSAPGYSEMFTEAGFGDLVAFARSRPHPREIFERTPDDLVYAIGAVGDAATVRARISEFIDAGVDDVVLIPSVEDDPGGRRTLTAVADDGVSGPSRLPVAARSR